MADTISLCFNNAEIMLDCIYEDYESEIENFFDNGHESKVYRWKFKRWVNTYQNYLNDLKLCKEVECSLIFLSIKESFELDSKIIKVSTKHIKSSKKHIILFKDILNNINIHEKKHFNLIDFASFFLPIFDMLTYVLEYPPTYNDESISDTKLTKDNIKSYKIYLESYIKKIEKTYPLISNDTFDHFLEIINLYIKFIFLSDIKTLDNYIKNNPIKSGLY